MGNSLCLSSPTKNQFKKVQTLPIETTFKLPSPLPSWSQGGGFARGVIDLGGLQVCQISSFNKIWGIHEGGPDNLGATFFEPSSLPEGFSMLGCYSQPNNKALFGWVLVGKDDNNLSAPNEALKKPVDYTLIWSSKSLKIKNHVHGYVWLPVAPNGYTAVGNVITTSAEKPSLDKVRCVRSDLTEESEIDSWIWGSRSKTKTDPGINVYQVKPRTRGTQATGVSTGAFVAQIGDGSDSNSAAALIACLKNKKGDVSSMPSLTQIEELVQEYAPLIYLHPEEEYLPSSVDWFFANGALLYKKSTEESKAVPIEPMGSNLPQGGSNDGLYWLDFPVDEANKERVKKGDLQSSQAYIHVKPILGTTFTDIVIWVFFPFNGPARAKVEFVNIPLGKIGEHRGDWEHVTLRVSNFNGGLHKAYFSEHSGGTWVDASELEFQNGNRPVVYSALHGHAFYSKPGLVMQGSSFIGIRNDTAKSDMVMDTGLRPVIVAAEYLGSAVSEPPWLNYNREWGPKISYEINDEINKVEKLLDGKLKTAFQNIIDGLPNELLGEEGPTGPKMKRDWCGDEV